METVSVSPFDSLEENKFYQSIVRFDPGRYAEEVAKVSHANINREVSAIWLVYVPLADTVGWLFHKPLGTTLHLHQCKEMKNSIQEIVRRSGSFP